MHLLNAKNNHGFTLFELLTVVVMIGVLAALGIPSLLGMINASRVRDAQTQVQGIIRGAQRQALSQGITCRLQFNLTTNPVTINDTNTDPTVPPCLTATTLVLPRDVKIVTNLSGNRPTLAFNYKGRVNRSGTIVFRSDRANIQRCLDISQFIAMMRSGDYRDPENENVTSANPSADNCNTTTENL
jgi:prepilin-type N-terminal cleavage/methylation domain-containing protein